MSIKVYLTSLSAAVSSRLLKDLLILLYDSNYKLKIKYRHNNFISLSVKRNEIDWTEALLSKYQLKRYMNAAALWSASQLAWK